jgi:hypothetical protein
MFMVSLQILEVLVLRVVRYVLDVLWFPCKILGLSVACCSLCVGCLCFPANFSLVLRVVRHMLDVYGFPQILGF